MSLASHLYSRDRLHDLVARISRIAPGQALTVSRFELGDIGSAHLVGFLGPKWSPVDRILENIVGGAYEFTTSVNSITGDVTFYRLAKPLDDGRVTYVSPDRADRFCKSGEFYSAKQGH